MLTSTSARLHPWDTTPIYRLSDASTDSLAQPTCSTKAAGKISSISTIRGACSCISNHLSVRITPMYLAHQGEPVPQLQAALKTSTPSFIQYRPDLHRESNSTKRPHYHHLNVLFNPPPSTMTPQNTLHIPHISGTPVAFDSCAQFYFQQLNLNILHTSLFGFQTNPHPHPHPHPRPRSALRFTTPRFVSILPLLYIV